MLLLLAWQLINVGVTPRALVDTTPANRRWSDLRHLPRALGAPEYLFKGLQLIAAIRRARVPWYRGALDLRAEGEGRLQRLRFSCDGRAQRIETGTLLLHQGVIPSLQLAAAAGCESEWNEAQQCWQPRLDAWGESSQPGIFVAGDAGAIGGARAAQLAGQLAGLQVAHRLEKIDAARRDRLARPLGNARERHLSIRPLLDARYRVADASLPRDETLACRCEEVSVAELRALASQGCSGPNQAKAFSRCGMGPCQGRFCGATMERVFALETGAAPRQVGHFNARPPVKPVTLGQLAGGEANGQITEE